MWVVYYIQLHVWPEITRYGIRPRESDGLIGILTAPFLHGTRDFGHIINNSIPMFVLTWALYYFYKNIAGKILFYTLITTGLCVWTSGMPGTNHIGMSGVIYGLAGFLFTSGVVRKNKHLLAISMLVVLEYGSMIWGVFPIREGVSWESHLWGLITGIVLAIYYKHEGGPVRKKYLWEIEEELGLDNYEVEYWKVDDPDLMEHKPQSTQDAKPMHLKYHYRKKSDGIQDD